jgi:RHS repeat-associated protein
LVFTDPQLRQILPFDSIAEIMRYEVRSSYSGLLTYCLSEDVQPFVQLPADSAPKLARGYVWSPAGLLLGMVKYNTDGSVYNTYMYLRNGDGDIMGLVDKDGAVVATYAYDPCGRPLSTYTSASDGTGEKNPFRWGSMFYDAESGLYWGGPENGSRYYNPELGRWNGRDAGGDCTSPNLYTFNNCNPVNKVLWTADAGSVVTAVCGGTSGPVDTSTSMWSYFKEEWDRSDQRRGDAIGNAVKELGFMVSDLGNDLLYNTTFWITYAASLGAFTNGGIGYTGHLSGIEQAFDSGQMEFGLNWKYSQYVGENVANGVSFGLYDQGKASVQLANGSIGWDEWGDRMAVGGAFEIVARATMPAKANINVGATLRSAGASLRTGAAAIESGLSRLMGRIPARRGAVVNPASLLAKAERSALTQSVGDLRAAGLRDAHHVIQEAAVRSLPGYSSTAARGVRLRGPSTLRGSPHYNATQVQKLRGGGTYAAERRIGYRALRRAGDSEAEARQVIQEADAYFRSIGVDPSTPTHIPGNRIGG